MECASQLRQLGIASHHFHDVARRLPNYGGWWVEIGPYIETKGFTRCMWCPAHSPQPRPTPDFPEGVYLFNDNLRCSPCGKPLAYVMGGKGTSNVLLALDATRDWHRHGWNLLWCDGRVSWCGEERVPIPWFEAYY